MSIQYSIVNAVFGGWQQFEDCLGICRFPGIPVWLLSEDSRFPGIPYVIFPGNVGTLDSLAQVITVLRSKH